ncbi:MAG: methylenetetrahydrofolate reductase [Proteobacteria bacterium]|nr:methylenetetrahydrofolate reductase [Pseudomonadota bacterium]
MSPAPAIAPRGATNVAAADVRVTALLAAASLEIPAHDPAADAACRDLLAPGTAIHIHHPTDGSTQDIVATAARLTRAGLTPVPHIAARALESFTRLHDYLARAVGEAGVTRVLVIGGDNERPAGPYRSSFELLETGLFQKHGIRQVGIAGYPERHPGIAGAALDAARAAKLALIRASGLEPYVVTQFCLEAAPISGWIAAMRAGGVDCPIYAGLAGPAPVATLAQYAVRCGVGVAIRSLAGGQTALARMVREAGPEPILRALARADHPPDGLHVFSFGGVAHTAAWLAAAIRGDFTP